MAIPLSEVSGLSVTNLNISPRTKVTVPTIRNKFISRELGFNKSDTNRAAPITDIKEMSAKTEERKENRYSDPRAEIIIPRSVNILVD